MTIGTNGRYNSNFIFFVNASSGANAACTTPPTTRIVSVFRRRVVRAKRGRTRMKLAALRARVAREVGTGNSMANRVLTALHHARHS